MAEIYKFSRAGDPSSFAPDGIVVQLPRRPGTRLVAALAPELGAATKLSLRNGRLLAQTTSGIPVILPLLPCPTSV